MSSGLPAGPAISSSPTNPAPSTAKLLHSTPPTRIPTFSTHLIIPFSVSINEFKGQGRVEASGEIRETFTRLVNALQEKGLKVTSRRGRGKLSEGKEIWIFISGPPTLLHTLHQQELATDARVTSRLPREKGLSDGDEIRLIHEMLVSVPEQGGIGITPGEGEWRRVKSIVAVHDDVANHQWIQSWIGKEWWVGLIFGKDDSEKVRSHFGESLATYFSFLSFYTLSLAPLSIFGILFWTFSISWSWIYALGVSIWGISIVEIWKIQEKRLQESFGVAHVDKGEHLRPQFVASLHHTAGMSMRTLGGSEIQDHVSSTRSTRDLKVLASIPVILLSSLVLGAVITATFILEAFLTHLYSGPGKQVIGLLPTLIFVGVVPSIVAAYHRLSVRMTGWEGWPTKGGWDGSLTVKTFTLNAVTAYLGLFLSAYIYVPFGELIMSYLSIKLAQDQHMLHTTSAEGAGLSPSMPIGKRVGIKSDRLVNQMFAYTVTNQVVNAFTELGLPFIMRYISAWRDNSSIPIIGSAKGKASEDVKAKTTEMEMRELDKELTPDERKFLDKVGMELSLPDYNIFVDYAEMVTQFGYITLWSIIWPLAPLFAFVNNYVELRSDAVKICSHVRRPIPVREATIGVWADTMTFLTWLAALTNATLVYLFKPDLDDPINMQSINPDTSTDSYSTFGTNFLHSAMRNGTVIDIHFSGSKRQMIKAALPSLIPVLFVALSASHGFLALRWVIRRIIERVVKAQSSSSADAAHASVSTTAQAQPSEDEHFWRGTDEGMEEIRRVLKVD